MSRTTGSNGARTADAVRSQGLKLIYTHGYEGFGLRQLAMEVGVQPASLYNYFSSKQDLLFRLISDHLNALIRQTETVLERCVPETRSQLAAFTANHLEYHVQKKYEVHVANFELRALTGDNLTHVVSLRRRYESLLIAILDRGKAGGVIDVVETHVVAYAILAMLTGACTWYKPTGRLAKAELIALHVKLVLSGCLSGACSTAMPPPAVR